MHQQPYHTWSERSAENALSLAAEARLLLNAKYYPRAYYLAHMSTEESAKSILLHIMSTSGTPEAEVIKVSTLLQNHKKKIEFLVTYASAGSPELQDQIAKLKDSLISHINDLKNNTMYVSYKAGSVFTPAQKVASVNVDVHVALAEALAQHAVSLQTHDFRRIPKAAAKLKR